MVRVRLFAALREAADTAEAEAPGKTVGDVVDALSDRFGERFAAVAAVSSFVVNGERAARSTAIAEGDEVALLPPVSGDRSGDPELIEQQEPLGVDLDVPDPFRNEVDVARVGVGQPRRTIRDRRSTSAHAAFAAAGSLAWSARARRIALSTAGSQKCATLKPCGGTLLQENSS